jgi:hypothetical protein
LISRRNHDPWDPLTHCQGIPRSIVTAVIYPVVKVRRRSGSASAGLSAAVRSSCPLVGGLTWSTRVSGHLLGSRTRDDGSRTSLRTVGLSRGGTCEVVPGLRPGAIRSVVPGYPGPEEVLRISKVGGDEETRTPDPLLAKEMLFQLSYVPVLLLEARGMVGVSGLEPETSALSGQCSNQLS